MADNCMLRGTLQIRLDRNGKCDTKVTFPECEDGYEMGKLEGANDIW
jgi:hypothetical protein